MSERSIEPNNLGNLQEWRRAVSKILENTFPPPPNDLDKSSTVPPSGYTVSNLSNWTLVCEEMLDTEHPSSYLSACYKELLHRGKTPSEIARMREFAWLTVGWLNFGKMLWDWVNLNEDDIVRAIEWQYKDNQISSEERQRFLAFLELHR